MKDTVRSKRKRNHSLTRYANVIADKSRDFGLIGLIEVTHDAFFGGVIDLSLNKVKKPRVKGVRGFKDNGIRSMVLTARRRGVVTTNFTGVKLLNLRENAQ